MSIIFDPTKMLKKIAPKAKVKRMVSSNFSVKRTILATIDSEKLGIDKASVGKVARKTLLGYKERVAKAVVDAGFEKAAGTEEKQAILADPKQLVQRVQNEVVFQVHQGIKDKYAGQRARWLPSDAEEPRPEHQANYGKVYIIGEGIDGVEPGDEFGCRCGVEILTDETQLDLS